MLGLLSLAVSACMTSPTNNHKVESFEQTASLEGYTFLPNSTVTIEAFNQSTASWEVLATTTTGATPSISEGIVGDNPALYAWSVQTQIASASEPSSLCRWSPTCQILPDRFGAYSAQLRATEGTNRLQTFEARWDSCVDQELLAGGSFTQAAIACQSPSSPELRLRDIYEWSTVPDHTAAAAPALMDLGSRLYIASVTASGQVHITRTRAPGAFVTDTLPAGAPPDGFAADSTPVLLKDGNTLQLITRGADNNLYRAIRSSAGWTNFEQIIADGSVTGRVSAALTQSAADTSLLHIVYASIGGTVAYRRFQAGTSVGSQLWPDALEATIGSNGTDQVAVAVRRSNRLTLQRAAQSGGWQFATAAEPFETLFDISDVVHLNGRFHVVYAHRRTVNINGDSSVHVIAHLHVPAIGVGFDSARVANYQPSGTKQALTALVAYRGRLIAAWDDASNGVRSARWDVADPDTPWIAIDSVGKTAHQHRPALVAANLHTFVLDHSANAFGDDVYAASTRDGKAAFTNLSRNLMRRDIEKQFTLYNYEKPSDCPSQDQPDAPVFVPDPWQDDRALVTEIGFNLWMLPNWFINGQALYQKTAQGFCEDGRWLPTGRVSPPCYTSKLPVIAKPAGGLYICAGVWVDRADSAIRIWEELGHYVSFPLGIDNSSSGPEASHAALSGIPLAALQQAHTLFKEGTSTCQAGPRCRGFTGAGGNYDATGREHSFLYTIYYYLVNAAELRQYVQEDLAVGNDLLKRKYDWVKQNIFRGVEF
jgi:hypothetical protein